MISVGTSEDLAGLRLGHSQDVFQLFEVIEFGLFLPRQVVLFLALNQFGDSLLRLGRRSKTDNRLWGCTGSDEVDDLEVGRANCTHMALIITLGDAFQKEMRDRSRRSSLVLTFTFFHRSARVFGIYSRISLTVHLLLHMKLSAQKIDADNGAKPVSAATLKLRLLKRLKCTLKYEKLAWDSGAKLVAGVDEVGRGSLFGPVVAAAVILDPSYRIRGLRDSKLLDRETREKLAPRIREHALAWAIAAVDVATIDQINIYWASKRAMEVAVGKAHASSRPPADRRHAY